MAYSLVDLVDPIVQICAQQVGFERVAEIDTVNQIINRLAGQDS